MAVKIATPAKTSVVNIIPTTVNLFFIYFLKNYFQPNVA